MEHLEETIGARLRQARNRKMLTIPMVNEITGISRGNLSGQENDNSKPSSDALIVLSQLYGVTADWLLKGDTQDQSMIREAPGTYEPRLALSVPNKELREMITAIVETWEQGDANTKGWVIVQLRNAFPEIARLLKTKELK